MYSNELFIPIFGYGAKTFKGSSETSNIFPMSRNMSNPLVPNQEEIIHDTYAECLNHIKLDVPVKLGPTINFLKELGSSLRDKQDKRTSQGSSVARFSSIFHQCFILTTGIIDDIDAVLKMFECSQWASLPLQICFINIYQKSIQEQDLDSLKLRDKI